MKHCGCSSGRLHEEHVSLWLFRRRWSCLGCLLERSSGRVAHSSRTFAIAKCADSCARMSHASVQLPHKLEHGFRGFASQRCHPLEMLWFSCHIVVFTVGSAGTSSICCGSCDMSQSSSMGTHRQIHRMSLALPSSKQLLSPAHLGNLLQYE